jgi:hypothetical protein
MPNQTRNKLNEENIAIEVTESTVLRATRLSKTSLKEAMERRVAHKTVESVTSIISDVQQDSAVQYYDE